ncbi:cytochrome P450 2U1-like [Amphiura filiformis]|uniref:cytochrome P450 2U1-like n=1 Tax=Amphiura filiformis TaxID=82378 RepID=UPI003B21A7CF
MTELSRQYGKIYSMSVGPILVGVVINDAQTFREAFITKGEQFIDRNIPPLIKWIAPIEGSFLFENGMLYKERRRFGMHAFRAFGVGQRSLETIINEEARHLCDLLDQQDEGGINPFPFVSKAVSNIICFISFGRRYDYTDPEFNALLGRFRENEGLITFQSFANFLPFLYKLPMYDKHRENFRKTRAFIEGIIEEHKNTFDRSDMRDIIDMYLDEMQRQKEEGASIVFNERSMWRSILDLFGAGSDTSSNTLLWGLLFICYDPLIQSKIQAELDRVIGTERPPSMKDRAELPYTTATIAEMLRVRPSAPMTLRGACSDVKVGDYIIPKGTTVFGNIWAVNHDPELWDDPDKFNPERFLSEDGKEYVHNPNLVTFGAGRRICLGKQLAEMELFLFVTNLLQRFSFSFPPDQLNPDTEGILGLGHFPRPYKVCLKQR